MQVAPEYPGGISGGVGGVRVSNIQKSGEAVKRLDRLAPNLAHVQIHLGMNIRQTNCHSRHKVSFGVLRGSNIQKYG